MPLLESATLGLGPPLAKAIVKLWLPDHPLAVAANDGIVEILRKRGRKLHHRRRYRQNFPALAPGCRG